MVGASDFGRCNVSYSEWTGWWSLGVLAEPEMSLLVLISVHLQNHAAFIAEIEGVTLYQYMWAAFTVPNISTWFEILKSSVWMCEKCSCSPFILLDVRLEGDLKFSEFYMDFISLSASAGFTDLSLLWCSLVSVLAIQSSCFLWDHIKLLNNTPRATTAIHLLKKVFHFNKKVEHYQKHLQRNHQESHNEGRDSLCFAFIWLFFMQKTLMTTWIRSKKETTANFNA